MEWFPSLYKRSATGKLLIWNLAVLGEVDSPEIHTVYGYVDGKMQETKERIFKGKNLGKANETTPLEQAISEAKAAWQRQIDSGYVEDLEAAKAGLTGLAVTPMLAHDYHKHAKKLSYPCFVQPKLDGIRCLAILDPGAGTVELYTRKSKRITSMTHIEAGLSVLLPNLEETIILDGELYNHSLRDSFETIVSKVRAADASPGAELIEYHVYDCVRTDLTTVERQDLLLTLGVPFPKHVRIVPLSVADEGSLETHYAQAGEYEGIMLRNLEAPYEQKRSYNLLKYKKFDEGEFEILGIQEGRGKLAGHVGAFVCTCNGKEFRVKLEGSLDFLKECFEDDALWAGKGITVTYQGLTKAGVPRFPVGKIIRDYE